MRLLPRMAVLTGIAASASLTGCSVFKNPEEPGCKAHKEYAQSPTESPLRAPQGMQLPDQNGEMPLPSGPRAPVLRGPDGRCLESPPRYYAGGAAGPSDAGLPVSREAGLAPEGAGGAPGGSGTLKPGGSVLTNEVASYLVTWAEVWSSRDPDQYFSFYAADFAPAGYSSNQDWMDTQRDRFAIPARTEIVLDSLDVEAQPDGSVQVEFVQRFGTAPNYRSVLKEMAMTRGGPRGWTITSERILDVL